MRAPMEASVALQRSVGIDTRLVSPTEMREIEPRLRADDLVAGCYEPASGYCNPVETAQGFARAARAAGARILEDTAVVGLLVEGDRVRGVRTARGRHPRPRGASTRRACGARRVGAMAGVELPIHVCRHKISIVTWPEADRRPHPMVYDFVTNIYTRPEMGEHILVGGLDAEESHDTADPDAYREGVSLDESTEALARVSHRFPVLADGHIARGYAGCFDVTPRLASHPRPGRPGGLPRGRRLLGPRLQAVAGGGPHDGRPSSPRGRAAIRTCPPSVSPASRRASRSEAPTATG